VVSNFLARFIALRQGLTARQRTHKLRAVRLSLQQSGPGQARIALRWHRSVFALLLSIAWLWPGIAAAADPPPDTKPPLWKDPTQPFEVRVRDLVGRMTVEEKALQVCNDAPAILRLGLPAYNYWNECLHGVARNGLATVFPQAIGMAASFDPPLLKTVADTIATEARAKNREYTEAHDGDSAIYTGLSFWTPNINIFRDPRWGRGQETYGEDPFLTGRLAVAFIQGLQGDDPKYVKAMACAKHFAVHSGPEAGRHNFDAQPPERDFYETYLPQFEAAVREGHVGAVMGAYNRVYGTPACASSLLLSNLLRAQWGFKGHVVADCDAIYDIFMGHNYSPTLEAAATAAVKAGCDLCCGVQYRALTDAVTDGSMKEAELDTAVERLLEARFRLGMFDPSALVPYARIPMTDYDTPEHDKLALRMARETIVLLKNDGLLPLDRTKIHKIGVFGLNANYVGTLLGNYNGEPSHPVTLAQGIQNFLGSNNADVYYAPGCPLAMRVDDTNQVVYDEARAKALDMAKKVDAIVYCGGICADLERESMGVPFEGFFFGDRTQIELPPVQTDFLKALQATGKPLVFVNCSGSAMAMPWEAGHLPAIVQAWYPGQEGGLALAEVLFGAVNPAGRLPVTFYRSTADLPDFTDYSMSNRTYRYFSGKPLFAFGHGLSYTQFKYGPAQLDRPHASLDDTIHVKLDVTNIGVRDGDEVVQVYFRHVKSAVPQPLEALCGFLRVPVPHQQSTPVDIPVPIKGLRYWDTIRKQYVVEQGDYEILVGAASDDIRARLPLKIGGP